MTGRAPFTGDVRLPGMIWGDILRSHMPTRVSASVNTSLAEIMEGVLAVVTCADLPPVTADPIDMASDFVPAGRARANLFASNRVMYVGHPVAAVAAVDRNTARAALDKIVVEYEPLPAVLDVDAATADGAPVLHEDLEADHLGEPVKNTNIAWWFRYEFGDPDKAFADASPMIDREFSYSTVHQGYIEPQTAIALWREDDQIELWASTQGGFGARKQTAGLLGQPESSVTVHPTEIGGGFGRKTTVYLTPFAALLSRKTHRPVKLAMDRKTVFEATGPTPAGKIRVKMGVNDDGRIVAAASIIRFEAGAFPGWVPETASKSMFTCYDIPNTRVDGLDILVNKPRVNSYRGPSAPQVIFATESVVDEICEQMGWDRFDFRLANASTEGSRRSDGPRLGKVATVRRFRLLGRRRTGNHRTHRHAIVGNFTAVAWRLRLSCSTEENRLSPWA